ncbi:prepilin-type N-terminal cleavage/methylation domain-containing protein [Robinsoniella sp. KNHs210]|uniref:prepilin-type N-terminal cleavage/methylation domain-containing protein n=1 Tax=Robinsoniella sp. KNHs210 TaxID=1469950 RepID=UPI0006939260|nr:prepilin-type N-terminal cleavage/methylation domain-containing protein [Robinsoniella sp. KNHs210]
MQKFKEKLKNKKGFTLVEMIVVLAIIGILIALIAPNMARIIKDGQETSDAAKAKTALTAAQAYGTRQVSAGQTVVPGTAVGSSGAFFVELNNTAVKAVYSQATPGKEDFMSNTGDAYLNTNIVKGQDKLYVYISKEGAAMGIVYANGSGTALNIKAVAGFAPDGVFGTTTGLEFTTASLKDKKFTVASGVIG